MTGEAEMVELPPGLLPGAIEGAPGAMVVILSGPSGVGKDTILRELRKLPSADRRCFVVTYKSRAPRTGEVDGVDYHFVTPERFHEIRRAGLLLEAAAVHEQWSGTPVLTVRDALVAGRDPVLKIDVEGAETVKAKVPDAFRIFVEPPSLAVLEERLRRRGTETADGLRIRMRNAAREMEAAPDYDCRVINHDERAIATAHEIDARIEREHVRRGLARTRV